MAAQLGRSDEDKFNYIIPCPSDAGEPEDSLVLEVPLSDLRQLVNRPVRWMKLVAWGVLNCGGHVRHSNGAPLDEDMPLNLLEGGATYTFVPGSPTHNLLNFEHMRTDPSGVSSSASVVGASFGHTPEGHTQIIEDRDGTVCVFCGLSRVHKAHIIPVSFGEKTSALEQLSIERGFSFVHHLDPRNRISIKLQLHDAMDTVKCCFILASDSEYLRNDDIPEAQGPILGADESFARAEMGDQHYIFQYLQRLVPSTDDIRHCVRPNERARFKNALSGFRPCPKAINYVYAARMVKMYMREDKQIMSTLSRPVEVPPTHDPPSDDDHTDSTDSKHSRKRQKLDDQAYHGRLNRAGCSGSAIQHRKRPITPDDASAFNLLYELTHTPAFVQQRAQQQQKQEAEKEQWVERWQHTSAVVDLTEL